VTFHTFKKLKEAAEDDSFRVDEALRRAGTHGPRCPGRPYHAHMDDPIPAAQLQRAQTTRKGWRLEGFEP
jgi:hypothetical protein